MLLLFVAACTSPLGLQWPPAPAPPAGDPPQLDLRSALAGACVRDPVTVHDPSSLAVFEGPPPSLAVHVRLAEDWLVDGAATAKGDVPALTAVLRDKADTARDLAGRSSDPEAYAFRGELLLEVPADTPAPEVARVLQGAQAAGFHRIDFLGRSATPRPPPPPFVDPDLAARLDAAHREPPETRARAVDSVRQGILEACPPLLDALPTMRRVPESERCDAVVELMQASFPACPDADHRQIVTLFQYDPLRTEAVVTTLSTRLSPRAAPWQVGTTETWAEVAARLQAEQPATTRWVVGPPPAPQVPE